MAQIVCKYHHERPAKWHCDSCVIYFCFSCLPQGKRNIYPQCPVCHTQVLPISAENFIEPFWNRISKFFLYPIHFSSLLFLLILSFITMGIEYDPILAIILPILVAILFLKYAFMALKNTANGNFKVPRFTFDLVYRQIDLSLKQLLIFFSIAAFNYLIHQYFDDVFIILALVLSVIVSPAAIMVLASEPGFLKAFNPIAIWILIFKIGKAYLILCFFLLLLLISSEESFGIISKFVANEYLWPVYFFINMYFILIMYNMMGYVLFQFHEKLGTEIDIDLELHQNRLNNSNQENKSEFIIQAEILIKEGRNDLAIDKLRFAIKNTPSDFLAHVMLQKLLLILNKTDEYLDHSLEYVAELMDHNNYSRAIEILLAVREIDSTFIPNSADHRYQLAIELNKQNYFEVALACISNLHKVYPSYKNIPKAYLLAATILYESFDNDEKALKILNFIVLKYQGDELEAKVRQYIDTILIL